MGGSQSGIGHKRRVELVVVALPADDDPVRKYSSEKEPHLTLLYLGSPELTPVELVHIIQYVEHAASYFEPFGLDVTRRGELGPNKADVLFFNEKYLSLSKNYVDNVAVFRDQLLKDDLINRAYLSANQFPEWIPHLTMGFPETPAKKKEDDFGLISWVRFDKIALWTGDSTGPTFQLESDPFNRAIDVGMSQTSMNAVTDILAHHGVKGMKWGVRRTQAELDADSTDVAAVKTTKAKIHKNAGKTDSISNKELRDLVDRMNLEQQYNKIKSDQKTINRGQKKTKDLIGKSNTLNEIYNVVNSPLGKTIRKSLIGV